MGRVVSSLTTKSRTVQTKELVKQRKLLHILASKYQKLLLMTGLVIAGLKTSILME